MGDNKKEQQVTTALNPESPLGKKNKLHPMTVEIDGALYDEALPIRDFYEDTWREIVEFGIRNYVAQAKSKPAFKMKRRKK